MSESESGPSPEEVDQDWLDAVEYAERKVPYTRDELWEGLPCAPQGHERRPGWDDTQASKNDSCIDT